MGRAYCDWLVLWRLCVVLVFALLLPNSSSGAPSFSIQIAFQRGDLEVARRLSSILEPQLKTVLSELEPTVFVPDTIATRLARESNLFILTSPEQATFLYAASNRGVATVTNTPGPTIHAVTLSTYGSKVIDDTGPARGTWSRKVLSAGVTDFQVSQARLLFDAMGLRCVDQDPTRQDSLKCQRNDYWDQPGYLVDRREGTEAFLVWGEKCEDNVRRAYRLRPREFRLIPIPPLMVGRLRERSQLPYVPDKMNTVQCTQQASNSGRQVDTGTLFYSLNQSSRSPDPRLVSLIAARTGRFLLERFPKEDLIASATIMNRLVPFLPSAADAYATLGLLRR